MIRGVIKLPAGSRGYKAASRSGTIFNIMQMAALFKRFYRENVRIPRY